MRIGWVRSSRRVAFPLKALGLACIVAIPAILAWGAGGAASVPGAQAPDAAGAAAGGKTAPPPGRAVLPEQALHDAGAHKVLVRTAEQPALDRLTGLGVVKRRVDYGSLQLLVVDDRAVPALREPALANVTIRDDMDFVAVNRWLIDTRVGEPADLPWDRLDTPGRFDRQLYLVQMVGPARDEWLADLTARGDAAIVASLPSNAFALFASPSAWARMSRDAGRPTSPIQWAAAYHPAYRIAPGLEAAIARDDREVDVVVQLVEHAGTKQTVADLKARASAVLMDDVALRGLRDVRVRIPARLVTTLAAQPDVFWIEPCLPKIKMDERQGQIMAGNLDATGSQPSAPGYLSWLSGKGFGTTFPFTVDVADDGFDRGSTTDVHQDFKDASGTPRVTYISNYTTDPSGDGGGGHGNLNAAIVGGYNDTQGNSAFDDPNGYQYGLGIAPFARLGASKIFSNAGAFTSTAYSTLIANAWNNGARISSNSWGLTGTGANLYTTDSRSYDILVRDAASGTAGNQEMAIVFAAGNAGSGANTVSAPGTAKNVITAGASENFRQTGTDGCGIANTGADNAKDIISFSSRGPTSDGRKKPDLMAPGTHVQAAASRSANYDGSGVCNQYWPTGQTLYAWSSGTSHSTPGIAGAVALARQWFANQGWGTPSPAMLKAFLAATPTYMTGVGANDTLPSNNQGYGRLNLGRALDGATNLRVDQTQVLGAAGQTYTTSGTIASSALPFRVMLAWTDAPGATSGNAWVNDLDLEVTVNGTLYRGNVFSGSGSVTGGVADTRNNTEAVFLPAGTTGSFSITVRATAVNGDGVPGNADTTDQDFALFVYNGSASAPTPDFTLGATPSSQTVTQGGSTSFTTTVTSVNGFASATTLSVSGLPAGASASFAPNPVTPPAGGAVSSTLSVTTDASTPAGTSTLTITGTSGALSHSTTVSLQVQASGGGGNQVLTFSAAPGLAIPDNNTTGVTSTIAVAAAQTITSVSVNVNITHTYQGDLEVALIGPDNTTVLLHNQTGAGADNIVTTYNITTRSNQSLGAFTGKSTSGSWRLRVRDLAAVDVGTLNSWKVTFNGYSTASPGLAIPDNNTTGVTSTLNVTATGSVADLRVRVNITHTYQGDLEVSLIAPDNTTVLLHNRTGAGTDNISTVYPDLTVPAQSLAALTGKSIAGAWRLKVRDLAAVDVGTLNSWEIDFRAP
ncbi:MAG TPA: proprotein convertase P-domain-containing protein [Candidatus Polarisedimenticolia bacterium]|nr:proprotein convertase P-domain-containing protein [Candidatus Polarisedimenticolia bacterium]